MQLLAQTFHAWDTTAYRPANTDGPATLVLLPMCQAGHVQGKDHFASCAKAASLRQECTRIVPSLDPVAMDCPS